MVEELQCWKCGFNMGRILLPMSRREECPACSVDQRVCKMCRFYAKGIADCCREDRAEAVSDKEMANFCDYFEPRADAYSHVPTRDKRDVQDDARAQLAALFGDEPPTKPTPEKSSSASQAEAMDELRKLFGGDE